MNSNGDLQQQRTLAIADRSSFLKGVLLQWTLLPDTTHFLELVICLGIDLMNSNDGLRQQQLLDSAHFRTRHPTGERLGVDVHYITCSLA